jgi:hypothetical protein
MTRGARRKVVHTLLLIGAVLAVLLVGPVAQRVRSPSPDYSPGRVKDRASRVRVVQPAPPAGARGVC